MNSKSDEAMHKKVQIAEEVDRLWKTRILPIVEPAYEEIMFYYSHLYAQYVREVAVHEHSRKGFFSWLCGDETQLLTKDDRKEIKKLFLAMRLVKWADSYVDKPVSVEESIGEHR